MFVGRNTAFVSEEDIRAVEMERLQEEAAESLKRAKAAADRKRKEAENAV